MPLFRKTRRTKKRARPSAPPVEVAVEEATKRTTQEATIGYNPQRDNYLFWLTEDGYIIAQDVNCQYDYVQATPCPTCGGPLRVMAHINRGGQGLSELVAVCGECRGRTSFIFDISNTVFQTWWSEQLGPLYVRQYDGPPREPYAPGG